MADERHAFLNALQQIRLQHGLDLAPDEEGMAVVEFQDDVACLVIAPDDSDLIYVRAHVAQMPGEGAAEVAQAILRENLFCIPIQSTSLGLDTEEEAIILTSVLPAEGVTAEEIEAVLTGYHDYIVDFRERLAASKDLGFENRDRPPHHAHRNMFMEGILRA